MKIVLPPGLSGWLGALSMLLASGVVPGLRAEPPQISRLFAKEAPDSLIHRLRQEPARLVPGTSLALQRKVRWEPTLGVAVVETVLRNQGATTEGTPALSLFSASLPETYDEEAARYRKLSPRNDVWYGSTYWTGPDWTRVGKDWHHPGTNTPSVRKFTAPRSGRVEVTGRVWKADTNNGGGDGVRASVRHGPRLVWEAEIDGDDTRGVTPELSLAVQKGDTLRFVVHKRGDIYHDTTYWDPVITYDRGESFRASGSFSLSLEQEGPWSFEMDLAPTWKINRPMLHGYDSDLSLLQDTLDAGKPVVRTATDSLPIWILAGADDRSGIALALDCATPWSFRCTLGKEGTLDLEVSLVGGGGPVDVASWTLAPGEEKVLPRIAVAAYRGPWLHGSRAVAGLPTTRDFDSLRRTLDTSFRRLVSPPRAVPCPDLALWTLVQAEWLREDGLWSAELRQRDRGDDPDWLPDAYRDASVRHIEKTWWLLADLRDALANAATQVFSQELSRLALRSRAPGLDTSASRALYLRARWWKRHLALSNPLLDFPGLLFTKRVPTSYSHLVMQYFGWRARPGGGIFVLESPGYSLVSRDILEGGLSEGNVLEPRLSHDAQRIVFSYVSLQGKRFEPADVSNDDEGNDGFYHIYEVNTDGTGLRQLTDGPFDDLMPTYLPDGGIVFSSTRRGGYARCFGGQFSSRWHIYTLHKMDADGSNLRTLSFHDTNEWFPAVAHDGRVVYSRWDYIDRDAVTHQNLWSTNPDGTNPVALWGNATPSPHCTFQIQPIPGSRKLAFTASAHHSITAGSIAVLDPGPADNGQDAITRITPEVPFPEAESRDIREYYASPWPLSEKYFLVSYSPHRLVWEPGANDPAALGIYLLDTFGNREVLYRDPEIGSTNPCPLVPRETPPSVATTLPPEAPSTGEMLLLDVYRDLGDVPPGSVKQLRIVQVFPKTTPLANIPPIGLAGEENGRAILGTVPVEEDGSARFVVPSGKPVLFQALDKDGFALQVMRSTTYLQPGERVSCIGCHENRRTSPPPVSALAARRPASKLTLDPIGRGPFSFVGVVQPILDRHCVRCHGNEKTEGDTDLRGLPEKGFTRSYLSLCGDRNFWGEGTNPTNAAEALVPRFGARNRIEVTPPGGQYGARGSRLLRMLRKGHEEVKLSPEELRRLAAWIDLNAIFYGVNDPAEQARQLRGEEVAMPALQ